MKRMNNFKEQNHEDKCHLFFKRRNFAQDSKKLSTCRNLKPIK